MKVTTIVGARPQFIKAAVVSAELAQAGITETLIHTGQHFDVKMSDVFFSELGLPAPAHHLGIASLSHGAMTGRMLEQIEAVLLSNRPDLVLVYGDTNSTTAGALAAAKLHIPVAHVEAGMRSFNRKMPEEQNRIVTDHLATLQLVTSEEPKKLLAREGITQGVHVVGDVMLDATRVFAAASEKTQARQRFKLPARYGLVTLHRAENTDAPAVLHGIASALRRVSEHIPLVWPIHPRTRMAADKHQIDLHAQSISLVEPVGYLEMLDLEKRATLVLTDSGGVQKEAYFVGVPCITLRDETEWTEIVATGWNSVCGTNPERIYQSALQALREPHPQARPAIFGDGYASKRIARVLLAHEHDSNQSPDRAS